MKSIITSVVGLAIAGVWVWRYTVPLLDEVTTNLSGKLGLLTLLVATLLGGLSVAFGAKRTFASSFWVRPMRRTFLVALLLYLIFNVPNTEGRVFVLGLLNADWSLMSSRAGLFEGVQALWLESRGCSLSEEMFERDTFLWVFMVPFALWLLWLPAWKAASTGIRSSALMAGGLLALLGTSFGSIDHLKLASVSIAAPFGIFMVVTGLGSQVTRREKPRAASVRQPGIRSGLLHGAGALVGALWLWLYSWEELRPVLDDGWDLWARYLLGLTCLCLFLSFGTRLSPVALPVRLPLFAVPIWIPFLPAAAFFTAWGIGSMWIAVPAAAVTWGLLTDSKIKWRPWATGFASVATLAGLAWLSLEEVGLEDTKRAAACILVPFLFFWLPGLIVVVPEFLKEASLYRMLYVLGRGGAARFGGIYAFVKYDFTQTLLTPKAARGPIYAGKTTFELDPKIGRRHIGLDTDAMMLTCAGMGGGKSFSSIWNTTVGGSWPGGAFFLDPKGEHAQRSGKSRERANGAPSHYLDAWGQVPHLYGDRGPAGFNPFEEIDLESPNASSDLKQIAEACYLPEAQESANSKHFRENAITVAVGVMAHILSTMDAEYHNLPSVFNTFLTGHPDGGAADPNAFDDMVTQMAVNEAFSRAPMKAAKVLEAAGANERGGFLTSVATGLEWVIDDVFRPILMRSTFRMRDIKHKRQSVYLIVPFRKMQDEGVKRFMRLVTNFALWGCAERAKHPYKTLICLDEFPQLGTFLPIKEGLVTLRSIDVKIWMHCQHAGQLKERYGNWQDFMSACDKQFFAVNDEETAKTISGLLGEYMEPSTEGRRFDKPRPLRAPSEVLQDLRKGSGIQYLLPADGQPMRLKLVPFKRLHALYGKVR